MKLATYQDGSRDGQLLVVSRDLATAHYASGIATRLQQVLDDWNFISPQLEELSQTLNHGKARHAFAFEPARCMAPLPRAYQWAVAGGRETNDAAATLIMRRGASDALLGAHDDIVCAEAGRGVACDAQLAVITGDLGLGTPPDAAQDSIRLLLMANDMSVVPLLPTALPFDGDGTPVKPATAFSPVAATPDELGTAWRAGRADLKLEIKKNGALVATRNLALESPFDFGQILAHLCRGRPVRAGSIVGGGGRWRRPTVDATVDVEETFLATGDTIHFDIRASGDESVFGAIQQRLAPRA